MGCGKKIVSEEGKPLPPQLPTIELPPTPSIKFTGRIYPASFKVSLSIPLTAERQALDEIAANSKSE